MMTHKIINQNSIQYPYEFSICTIVNDMAEYEMMKCSFIENGFDEDCEYLIVDNTNTNNFDAYQAISLFLNTAKGRFLILVHQDVRVVDNKIQLKNCLHNLDIKHPSWAICGNAGAIDYHESAVYITYPEKKDITKIEFPVKVKSLDENFLLLKRSSNLTISTNLKGFHLYGTDLCIIAKFLGFTSYVIPFMVMHLSEGNMASLQLHKGDFIKTYGSKMKIGFMQTTCTSFYLSNSAFKNIILNSKIPFFLIKQMKRYPYLLGKLFAFVKGKIKQ